MEGERGDDRRDKEGGREEGLRAANASLT